MQEREDRVEFPNAGERRSGRISTLSREKIGLDLLMQEGKDQVEFPDT